MMPASSPTPKEIIKLLSKLKANTPDYSKEMMAARKTAFLKQAVTFNIQSNGEGGRGGQFEGGHGSGPAIGGSTTASGIALNALIGVGLVLVVFVISHFFHDQIGGRLEDKSVASENGSSEFTILPLTGDFALPTGTLIPTEPVPTVVTVATPEIESVVPAINPPIEDEIRIAAVDEKKNKIKSNPGLHLGQAEGTPAAPGHGNPGNINKPDKQKDSNGNDNPGKHKK